MNEPEHLLCNLIIPGVPKAGTTSLATYLNSHPQVNLARVKESHFFSRSDCWRKGIQFHNGLFSPTPETRYFLDASTSYCLAQNAITRLRRFGCELKIILILRNPVERVLSHYRWLVRTGIERRSLRDALHEDGKKFDPDQHVHGCYFSYLAFSEYSRIVSTWRDNFGIDNVHLCTAENLSSAPHAELLKIERFLDLPSYSQYHTNIRSNQTADVDSRERWKFVHSARRVVPRSVRRLLRESSNVRRLWQRISTKSVEREAVVSAEDIAHLNYLLSSELEWFWTFQQMEKAK